MSDEDLDRLFHDAVADIEPRRDDSDLYAALDEGRDGRGSWLRGAVAAAAAVVVVTAGAAYLHHRSGTGITPTSGRTVEATIYFTGTTAAGERLFAENHELTEVTVSDERTATPVTRYVFQGETFATRMEAEKARANIVGQIARGFYAELPKALAARGNGKLGRD